LNFPSRLYRVSGSSIWYFTTEDMPMWATPSTGWADVLKTLSNCVLYVGGMWSFRINDIGYNNY
jgi:hypothetical protein